MKEEDMGLSILKGYNLFYNYQKRNKKNGKKGPIDIRLLYYFQANISWRRTKRIEQSNPIYFEKKDPWRI